MEGADQTLQAKMMKGIVEEDDDDDDDNEDCENCN